jgi:hypothetical protein
MVGHNDITGYINITGIKLIKPFVNCIIGIGKFEKGQPFIAGKGDKVKAIGMLLMLKPDRHSLKILLKWNPGVSQPFTQNPSEKTPGGRQKEKRGLFNKNSGLEKWMNKINVDTYKRYKQHPKYSTLKMSSNNSSY